MFLPEIAMYCPGCPDIVMENAVRNAAILFCNLTSYVMETLDDQIVPAGTAILDTTLSAGEEVVNVVFAYVDGNPIEPVSEEWLQLHCGNWRTLTGTPRKFVTMDGDETLFPIPISDVVVSLRVAKRPTRTASALADVIYSEWRDAIVSEALSNLLLIPNQPFSNPQLAMVHDAKSNDWQIGAQAKSYKLTSNAPLRTASQPT